MKLARRREPMRHILDWVVEPGFISSQPVHTALALGAAAALLSAVVGVFTVVRGQSFAGHALTDVSAAGGSGALLVGVEPVFGFVGLGLFAAGVMDLIGVRRLRGRDLATGTVLGAATGLTALILYFDTTSQATTGATQQILFGSIFTVNGSILPVVIVLSLVALVFVAVLYRPLLLSTVSTDIARAKGVPERLVGIAFLATVSVAVGLSALAIGAILSTTLLVGPAAAALRMTTRMASAVVVSATIGIISCWIGVLLAYDSYYWGASHHGVPVSFFIVMLVFLTYLISGRFDRARRRATVSVTVRRAGRTSKAVSDQQGTP
jgi:zinc/manganese transport system permease protein